MCLPIAEMLLPSPVLLESVDRTKDCLEKSQIQTGHSKMPRLQGANPEAAGMISRSFQCKRLWWMTYGCSELKDLMVDSFQQFLPSKFLVRTLFLSVPFHFALGNSEQFRRYLQTLDECARHTTESIQVPIDREKQVTLPLGVHDLKPDRRIEFNSNVNVFYSE